MNIGTFINTAIDTVFFIPNFLAKTTADFLTPLVGFSLAYITAGLVWLLATTIQLAIVVLPIQSWKEKRERERALEEYSKSVTVNPDGSVMAVHTDSVEKVSPMLTAVPVAEEVERKEEVDSLWENTDFLTNPAYASLLGNAHNLFQQD